VTGEAVVEDICIRLGTSFFSVGANCFSGKYPEADRIRHDLFPWGFFSIRG